MKNKISALATQPGDHFVFIAAETNNRFPGTVLAREGDLAHIRWADGHLSWTPLVVQMGTVEVRHGQ